MFKKCLPLLGALVLASPSYAVTVNMSDFTYGAPADVAMTGTPAYDGSAGQFTGALTDGSASSDSLRFGATDAASTTSFVAWCAELTQNFSFGVDYDYTMVTGAAHFGAAKTTNLSRLFTAAQGFVGNSDTSAAMQAGIWEIIYETGSTFDLGGGTFHGTADTVAGQLAFDAMDLFLNNLGFYSASATIDVLENGERQDFLIGTVPEPETWALFAAGLGVIALLRRRRKA